MHLVQIVKVLCAKGNPASVPMAFINGLAMCVAENQPVSCFLTTILSDFNVKSFHFSFLQSLAIHVWFKVTVKVKNYHYYVKMKNVKLTGHQRVVTIVPHPVSQVAKQIYATLVHRLV